MKRIQDRLSVLAFRHQLSLVLMVVVVVCFVGVLWPAQYHFTRQLHGLLEASLIEDNHLLLERMQRRGEALLQEARALAGRAGGTDFLPRHAEAVSVDDLKTRGLLPADAGAEVVVVMGRNQVITLASCSPDDAFPTALQRLPAVTDALRGWLASAGELYQIAAVPIAAAGGGSVFTARRFGWAGSRPFGQAGKNGFVIFDRQGEIITVHGLRTETPLPELRRIFQHSRPGASPVFGMTSQGFSYLLNFFPDAEWPAFMLVRTVKYPGFTEQNLLFLSGIALLVTLLGGLLVNTFSRHLRSVLQALHTTVEQVERENYHHRVELPDKEDLRDLSQSLNEMMEFLEQQSRLHDVMAQVVSRDVVHKVLEGEIKLHGETREVAALTINIRHFSTIAEKLEAQLLLDFLNEYFTRMHYCVEGRGGMVDRYFGDNLIALFGLTEKNPVTAVENAVYAAQDMLEAVDLFNLDVAQTHGQYITVGIGIAFGAVVAGNIGASERRAYSVIGTTVKKAMSLQKLTTGCQVNILLNRAAYHLLLTPQAGHTRKLILCRGLDPAFMPDTGNAPPCYEVFSRAQSANPQALSEQIQHFENALKTLQAGDTAGAQNQLQDLVRHWPEDGPTRVLLNYCRRQSRPGAAEAEAGDGEPLCADAREITGDAS